MSENTNAFCRINLAGYEGNVITAACGELKCVLTLTLSCLYFSGG